VFLYFEQFDKVKNMYIVIDKTIGSLKEVEK